MNIRNSVITLSALVLSVLITTLVIEISYSAGKLKGYEDATITFINILAEKEFKTEEPEALEEPMEDPSPSLKESSEPDTHAYVPTYEQVPPSRGTAPIRKLTYSEKDLYWLSRVVSSESRGEPILGQIAVANVVMNRARDRGKTIKEVIFEKGQFCVVRTGTIYDEPTEQSTGSATRALLGEKVVPDNTYYFYNPKQTTSSWARSLPVFRTIGNHNFAGDKK